MPAPWSAKGAKVSPLVAADEFMILDSQDGTPATKNKRVRLDTVQTDLVTNVNGNNFSINNLGSLSINDSAINNTFTISSSVDLAANRTINLPLLGANDTFVFENFIQNITNKTFTGTANSFNNTSLRVSGSDANLLTILPAALNGSDRNVSFPSLSGNDTFALLDIANTFTQNQTITFADDIVTNGLTVANTDGGFAFGNTTAIAASFAAEIGITTLGNTFGFTTDVSITIDDTGSVPVSVLNLRQSDDSNIENRPLWEIQNNGTTVLSVAADGTFESVLTDGSIFVGDQNNNSAAIPTGLETKEDCLVATTADITLSGEQTIDGVLTSASRVLVKNQNTASDNGIYLSAAGAWSRTTDADQDSEVNNGMFTLVTSGTVNANTGWVLTTSDPITVGVTNLTFNEFSLVTSGLPVPDTTSIVEGSEDDTKQLRFEIDGFTTATTRVLTPPDSNGTIVLEAFAQSVTNKTFPGINPNEFEDNALIIQNLANTFNYLFQTSAIGADRTVTLPLLLTSDTFVFENFIQSFTNKTFTGTANSFNNTSLRVTESGGMDVLTIAPGTLMVAATVSFPNLTTATDTFALLGVSQTFTDVNTFTAPRITSASSINDVNGRELILFPTVVASAVNEITISNSISDSPVTFTATGDDTDIDVRFIPKGTGTFYGNRETWAWPLTDEINIPTTGLQFTTEPAPYDMRIESAIAGLTTAGTGGVQATGTVTCVAVAANDELIVNGLVYTAVNGAKADNTEFDRSGTDNATATDLADSITNDTRTGIVATINLTAIAAINVVTITASVFGILGNTVGLSSSDGGTLAVSGANLAGGIDLFTVDVLKEDSVNGNSFTSIFSTKPTINNSEFTSTTATTPPFLNNAPTWQKGTRLQLSIFAVDANVLARGVKIELINHAIDK